jgi:hypothetical protein
MRSSKKVVWIVGGIVAIPAAAATVYGLVRTAKIRNDPRDKIFLAGRVPEAPAGLYRGSFEGREVSWKGKKFQAAEQKGINLFLNKEGTLEDRYPFRTYVGRGVKDEKLDVFKIDYDIEGNPLWLRRILDEVVEVEPGKLLGKVHVQWILGLTFTAGFFELERVDTEKPRETPQEEPAASS